MKSYLTYFKSELMVGLQYRVAAFAGLATQFFWGIMYALIYSAFYSHTNINSINLSELMSYVWLNQAFLTLIYVKESDVAIKNEIKDGTVAYELCRPYSIYLWWFLKLMAKRIAKCMLRFAPVVIVSLLLPKPYNLSFPIGSNAFILFLISLLLGAVLITSINMIVTIIAFFTYQDKGISSIVVSVLSLFSGFFVPIPLMPNFLIKILEYTPFRLIGDLPFRIYSGNIGIAYGINSIFLQLIWIIIFIFIGKQLLNHALKKVCIQGG